VGGNVARMGDERGIYSVLVGRPELKRLVGRPRRDRIIIRWTLGR
jgi:hypothetical protein